MVDKPTFTNPLQTNNSALMIGGYIAGILAAKLPIFDFATWNYIIFGLGGVIFTIATAIINRKSVVVRTVADMPEVKDISLDKTVPGALSLSAVTPSNVVVK
jgi:hypothetical protein